ncbi:16S rRNA (guanine(966)-N(2))-methyltransferase RsmD [Exiguobacterium acetylicum]|uniref:16S rRNA (guanine(966)-N(2))-methyltransferase RsmD n=1 Tax=Exiguobacterium acetylicum TaxID=41170 RepID=UPI0024B6786D|nr:16S rRNA (guanine(966)-N(2))-methyltransferase RsmD [Exiguobacterium acetylicum]UKS55106.1 16S rRNA (guanine(966)-N(2))-methyltransferase RsmD [Exiguobacterium acetylicum]
MKEMRVISGERKGTRLKAVPGDQTRPTTDKVKESLFNVIGPYFNGGRALDLFAGSGGLGIESLSRGCDEAVFVDQHHKAVQTIQDNLRTTHYTNQARVLKKDVAVALAELASEEPFKLIYLDPPYAKERLTEHVTYIEQHDMLTDNGVIVCEHDSAVELPDQIGRLEVVRRLRYSAVISITLYEFMEAEEDHV